MDLPSQTVVDVLTFLLPGFITAAVYFALTPAPRPIPFERVVTALIYTMIVQALLFLLRSIFFWAGNVKSLGPWTSNVQLVWSVVIAIGLGLFLAWTTDRDKLHKLLRRWRITHQTSFASEWYGALCKNDGYIVLHLKGDKPRRLLGWAEEWPSVADKGHFIMANAEWLYDDKRVPLDTVHRVLVRAEEVEMVELMKINDSITPEESDGRSQGASTAAAATVPAGAGISARIAAPTAQTSTTAASTAKEVGEKNG